MVIYEFECDNKECDITGRTEIYFKNFEEYEEQKDEIKCVICKSKLIKVISQFGLSTKNFTHSNIDIRVGLDAEKKWTAIQDGNSSLQKMIKSGVLEKTTIKKRNKIIKGE